MAKIIEKIVQSKYPPKDSNVLWDDGENLKISRNGSFENVVSTIENNNTNLAVEVTVDNTTGNPSASGIVEDSTIKLAFSGLKGETGPQGNSGYTGAADELEVVNNLEDGGGASALSAGMGKLLYEMLTIPQASDTEVVIQPESWYVGQYITPNGAVWNSANYSITKVPIKLLRGDRLEVTTQVNGVSVISKVLSLGLEYAALVVEQDNSAVAEKTYAYSAEKEIEVVVTIKHTASYKIIKYPASRTSRFNILEESIDELTSVSENIVNELQLSNSSNILSQSDFTAVPGIPGANNLWAIPDSSYASYTRVCKGGDTFIVQGNLANGSYVCFLQSPYLVGISGGAIIYATGYSGNGVKIAAGETVTFVAPDNAQRIVIIQYSSGKNFYPATISILQKTSVLSFLKEDVGKLTSATGVKKLSSIALNKTDYISTTRNYILKEVLEDSKSYFLYSNDLGVSWQKTENTIGDIQFVHWFSNGTCLICGTGKAYTTRDFITFTESEVYDKDGSIYTPNARTFFRLGNYNSEYRTLNDKEVVVWNDYGTESGYVSRVWYSDDYGKTLRCILKGSEMDVRHFHRTLLHDNTLWITSGDDGAQCKLISGHYENDEWDFNVVASGNTYKIGQLDIIPPYARMVTDYTNGNLPTGLIKCPLNHLSDASYLEYLVKLDGNPPVSSYWEDAAGNRVILPDGIGYKKLWYARGDMKFSLISITCDDNVAPMTLIGPNYNGDCIVNGVAGYGAASALHLNDKRYMLSDAFKAEGVVDFGKSLF